MARDLLSIGHIAVPKDSSSEERSGSISARPKTAIKSSMLQLTKVQIQQYICFRKF